MSLVESTAALRARATAIGLPDAAIQAMADKGWGTMGSFACSCSTPPGSAAEKFIEEVATPLLGRADSPHVAALRRLWYESFTLAAAELRTRIERKGDEAPRKMAWAEREARFKALEAALPGLQLREELEPAHRLTDQFYQQGEDGALRYVGWSECLRRDEEMLSKKRDRTWRADASGHIREEVVDAHVAADCSTDYKLRSALQRRGLAMHMAGLLSYHRHEDMALLLMREYTRDPPPGYSRLTLTQLQRADQEIFKKLADASRGVLVPSPYGLMPLDSLLPAALGSAAVRMLLAPLPAPAKGGLGGTTSQGAVATSGSRKRKATSSSSAAAAPKAAAKSKGPSKGKGRGRGPMPALLSGGHAMTRSGEPICFAFNLQGCDAGDACRRKHVCAKCEGAHTFTNCPQN